MLKMHKKTIKKTFPILVLSVSKFLMTLLNTVNFYFTLVIQQILKENNLLLDILF